MRTTLLPTLVVLLLFPSMGACQWLPGQSPEERTFRQQVATQKKAVQGAVYPISPGDAPSLGPADAPVVIVEYSDFQCPYCKRAQATVKELQAKYPDKVRLVFKNHPLAMHKQAHLAAEAALAADAQGKFWEMHDLLFAFNDALERADLDAYAEEIGLDMQRFNDDLASQRFAERIREESREVLAIGATGVPAIFVNGVYIKGAKPLAVYEQAVLAALGEIDAASQVENGGEGCEEEETTDEELVLQ
jgi:protein-disulfide isomerase